MNQSVLVTAGASGIGREIARAFAVQGAKVVVRDIDSKALETFAQEIPAITTVVCDVSKRHDIEHMVEAAIAVLAGLDVLVNNAGISGSTTPVEKSNPDDWEKVVQVNLIGTFNVTRLAIPHLKKSSAGVIIIMSSGAGRFGYANRSAYSATKWALIGFTKTLSIELGEFGKCGSDTHVLVIHYSCRGFVRRAIGRYLSYMLEAKNASVRSGSNNHFTDCSFDPSTDSKLSLRSRGDFHPRDSRALNRAMTQHPPASSLAKPC